MRMRRRRPLADHPRRGDLEDSADMNLALAEDLWKQGQKLCGASAQQRRAASTATMRLNRVLARLSRQ